MPRFNVVRPEALELVARWVKPSDRVLILGATGWFGRTAIALTHAVLGAQLLGIASKPALLTMGDSSLPISEWNDHAIWQFAPTIVLNFAFLTREKAALMAPEEYRDRNQVLTDRLLWASNIPSVRVAVTVSSGAALARVEGHGGQVNPYGELKAEEERAFLSDVPSGQGRVVARAWSVSGALVTRPRDYLFSDLILQAGLGEVRVDSTNPVWRRYVGVDDLLAVAGTMGSRSWSGTIDSGGELVEARSLASKIAVVLGARDLSQPLHEAQGPSNFYASDNASWIWAIGECGYQPATLSEQIQMVAGSPYLRQSP